MSQSFGKLLSRLKGHGPALAAAITSALVTAGAAAVFARLLGPLLQSVLLGENTQVAGWTLSNETMVRVLPAVIVAAAAVKALSQWMHGGLMTRIGQRVLKVLREDLYRTLLSLSPSWHQTRHSAELLNRFNTDVAAIEMSVTTALSSYVKDGLLIIALLGVCLSTDVRLSVLAFGIIPLTVLPVSRFARSVKRSQLSTQGSLDRLLRLTTEHLHHLPVVQAFQAEPQALNRFEEEQSHYLSEMKRSLFIRGAFTPTLELMGIAGVALCIGVGANAIKSEPALAGSLLTFLGAVLMLYQPLKALSGTFSEVTRGLASADRLFEILDARPEEEHGLTAAPLETRLELSHVDLIYPDGRQALTRINLQLERGEMVALMGPSGSGKSSLVALVLGLSKPTQGELRWNGKPYSDYSLSSLRAQMAWVSQEPLLLSGTIEENLKLGRPQATQEELWEALERADASEFVSRFPLKLEEEVGERGSRLSGGQRQRLAIARAFLMRPSLLLLDEPTSSLDEASQAEVQKGLAALMQGRTVLMVSHRLNTVAQAHRVIRLENGVVVSG